MNCNACHIIKIIIRDEMTDKQSMLSAKLNIRFNFFLYKYFS